LKRYQILALIILLVIGSIIVVVKMPTKRGLDLAGGVRIVLRAKIEELHKGETWNSDKLAGIVSVIRNRVDTLGVSEPQTSKKSMKQLLC
jgi:SecD/SecF fusion protein